MTYYLYMEQKGGGCDYTIGCGNRLFELDGNTIEEAKESSKQYFNGNDYGYGRGDYALIHALILKFEENAMPILNKILKDEEEVERKKNEERKLQLEKAEFERLKRKFGQ